MVQEKRHIAKTISYRILSSSIGFIVLYIATGSVSVGATFSTAELIFKPFIYYIHERLYYKYIKFGIKEKKEE
jgi:uncharacterized membrane protein